jgi:NAD(P)H-flavin reductase/ferredoxin
MSKIQVLPYDRAFECAEEETILAAALRQGLYVRYGCKHGGCGTCKSLLVDGDVEESGSTFALAPSERAEGWILACASQPSEDCVIDVSSMELTEEEFLAGDQIGSLLTEVETIQPLTPDIRAVRLRLVEPEAITFVAGQFVNVEIPGSEDVRAFSLANPPSEADRIDLIVKLLPGGRFSQLLAGTLRVGDRLRVYGPLGQLKIRLTYRRILMIAGGSGLAPLLSMLADLAHKGNTRPVTLFFGARRPEDLYCVEQIARIRDAMPVLEFIPSLSDAWPTDWSGETGLVTEVVARRLPSLEGYDAYLAGPPPMIDAAIPLLRARGVRARNIHFDAFLPTGGP